MPAGIEHVTSSSFFFFTLLWLPTLCSFFLSSQTESTVFFPEQIHSVEEDVGELFIPVHRSGDISQELMVVCYTQQGMNKDLLTSNNLLTLRLACFPACCFLWSHWIWQECLLFSQHQTTFRNIKKHPEANCSSCHTCDLTQFYTNAINTSIQCSSF